MSSVKRFLILGVMAVAITPIVAAALEIKLATLVPATSPWHKALLDMGNTWNKDTAGRVTLTVVPGSNITTVRIDDGDGGAGQIGLGRDGLTELALVMSAAAGQM